MKIPKYIIKNIEMNNKLLDRAEKHATIVAQWYESQIEAFDDVEVSDDEFGEIFTHINSSGYIVLEPIIYNILKLREEKNKND